MPEDYLYNLDTYGNYIGRDEEYGNKASTPIIREIPIKAWIWRNDDGSGNISIVKLNQIIDGLNQLFENNTNIRFYLLCNISEINNSNVANDGDEYFDEMCFYNKVSGAINVHFIINSNSDWGGKANFPDENPPGLRYTCAVAEYTLPAMISILGHEIGHTLGLYHTHSAGRSWSHSNNGGCGDCHQESVSRTKRQALGCTGTYNKLKCDVNGDFLCDTAADPELSNLVNYSCTYDSSGGGTDNWGMTWTPNTSNIMSYTNYFCRNYFSPLQVGKMNHYYTQIGINYPFYSINGSNYICNGQTATYSVASLPGVSHYEWDSSPNINITGGQGTNSVTVTASDSYGGYVRVSPGCGYNSRKRDIRAFYDLEIDGYDTACAQSGYTYNYSVPALSGASYTWSITDGIINYGQGTRIVNITLTPNSSNQTWLTLQVTGVCTTTVYEHKIITHGDPPFPAEQCFSVGDKPIDNTKNDLPLENNFVFFPNPAQNNVTIYWPSSTDYNLNIFDIKGRLIYFRKNINESENILNLENYKSGIYFIQLITNSGSSIVKKLIIKK